MNRRTKEWTGFDSKRLPRAPTGLQIEDAVACMRALPALAAANFDLCVRQESDRLHEFLMDFDGPEDEIPPEFHRAAEDVSASIPVR